jgi:energy-coupling factor transporter ATP-binding protein EcfA2
MAANMPSRLKISQFAHIENIDLELGDLTVLVGPQGSGKSLALQLFKLGHDRYEVVSALRDAAEAFDDTSRFLDLYLGRGMNKGLNAHTVIEVDRKPVRIDRIARTHRSADIGQVFYIPAQRALLLADGYPVPFKRLNKDTPAVARLFSETLFQFFGARRDGALFPRERELKADYREAINEAVYHGGEVRIDEIDGRYRLMLAFDDKTSLPFMTWTAGQREFTPLLFGLYHLLPPRRHTKADGIDWVVIEEPEMGLHPQALSVVMLLVLELLSRGYRVIISTHATLVLDVVFTLRTLGEQTRRAPPGLFEAFGIRKYPATQQVLEAALGCTYKTYLFELVKRTEKGYRVISKDISALDPSSDSKSEAEWGGLTGFSSKFNRVLLSE